MYRTNSSQTYRDFFLGCINVQDTLTEKALKNKSTGKYFFITDAYCPSSYNTAVHAQIPPPSKFSSKVTLAISNPGYDTEYA